MEHDEHLRCAGCGVPVQSEDENRPGYVPKSALQREDLICKRCFRIKHYNEVAPTTLDDDDFLRILHGIGDTNALVVMLVDIFDFNGSWLKGVQRFVGNNPVLLVGNKMDLLPRDINWSRVKHWLRTESRQLGLKPADVVLCSAGLGKGIADLLEAVNAHRDGQDVYIVGATNVGKSTLINRLLRDHGESDLELTTSRYPGTTLDLIEIPLDDDSSMYDTPGIINRDQISHYLKPEELKVVSPDRTLKPKIYQLNERQTLFLGGLARLDFLRGERQSFVVYASNRLYIHRTKLEKADELYAQHIGELLVPPDPETMERLPELTRHHFKLPAGKELDIVFSGLGWIAVRGNGAVVEAWAPEGIGVSVRASLI